MQLQVPLHFSKHMTMLTQKYWSQLSYFPYLKRKECNSQEILGTLIELLSKLSI